MEVPRRIRVRKGDHDFGDFIFTNKNIKLPLIDRCVFGGAIVVLFEVNLSQAQQSPFDNLARYKPTPNYLSTKSQNSAPFQIQAFVSIYYM